MLLRRVTEHVKEQNWFAVAIDFLIVVFGVLLAIQFSNWNTARAEREQGRIYSDRAIEVAKTELAGIDIQINYYKKVRAAALQAVEMLEGRAPIDTSDLVFNLYRATEYTYITRSRATYEEIIESGSLSFIEEDIIRTILVAFYSYNNALEAADSIRTSDYRALVRSHMPHSVQEVIRANCSDVLDQFGRISDLTNGCTIDLPDDMVEQAAATLVEQDDLLPQLRLQISLLNVAIANLEGDRRLAKLIAEARGS